MSFTSFTMHPLRLLVLLLLSAAAFPRLHYSYSTDYQRTSSPPESIEVTRPLPFDSLNPTCTLPIISHTFANTADLPATVADYTPPTACTWSNAVLHLSAACNGYQSDRIAAVWLSGVELLRTTTPQPDSDGTFWIVRKDVSRYSSLLRKPNASLAVMLENAVEGINNGVYQVNLTFMYYAGTGIRSADATADSPLSLLPRRRAQKLGENSEDLNLDISSDLNQNPADSIIPISATGDPGFWFKIESESDTITKVIQIPINTYKAVVEIYVSFHGNDEFWYSNPPNSYIDNNHLPTKKGNGSFREIELKIDGTSVGSVIPFPVIYAGGINPLFWKPLVPIGAFNLPSYELELTTFLGTLLDGKPHRFQLIVANAISYWLVDANLHLWLDSKADKVQAGAIQYKNPTTRVQYFQQFRLLDGRAEVQGSRQGQFSGWVSYSAGNITTTVEHKFTVQNTVEFKKGGMERRVQQRVEQRTKVRAEAHGARLSDVEVERKHNLEMTNTEVTELAKRTNLTYGKLESRVEERKRDGQLRTSLENGETCNGWALLRDGEIISGTGNTFREYIEKDGISCYRRRAYAERGRVKNDTTVPPCSRVSSSK